MDLATAFPGVCGGEAASAATLSDCLAARAACAACLALNDINDLGADCDTFDDGVGANLTCEPTLQ